MASQGSGGEKGTYLVLYTSLHTEVVMIPFKNIHADPNPNTSISAVKEAWFKYLRS